jgi:hypothetical protein
VDLVVGEGGEKGRERGKKGNGHTNGLDLGLDLADHLLKGLDVDVAREDAVAALGLAVAGGHHGGGVERKVLVAVLGEAGPVGELLVGEAGGHDAGTGAVGGQLVVRLGLLDLLDLLLRALGLLGDGDREDAADEADNTESPDPHGECMDGVGVWLKGVVEG